ncbi:MAG: hypothetical protein JNM80_14790 [Phycisphaerae bacterium]|nr:hypothetical protein [Phycisphaerae bacterium]
MNVPLLLVVAWLCLGLESGLSSSIPGQPGFVLPLAVLVALSAAPGAALWTCLVLGLCVDLLTMRMHGAGGALVAVPGPMAIGYLVAGQFVLALRGQVIRRNPLTLLALSVVGMAIAQAFACGLLTARHLAHPEFEWRPLAELGRRLLSALVTGPVALVMALVLLPLAPMFGGGGGGRRAR